jgi:hypothetical protein
MEDVMKKVSTLLAVAVVTSAIAAFSAPAFAGGLIGDLIAGACGNCGGAEALDEAHKQPGNPLDQAGAAAAQDSGIPRSPHCATRWGVFAWPWLSCRADAKHFRR